MSDREKLKTILSSAEWMDDVHLEDTIKAILALMKYECAPCKTAGCGYACLCKCHQEDMKDQP